MTEYTTTSPILFLVFNRPETTFRVFHEIRAVKPSRLYIAADGPRADKPNDITSCTHTLSILSQIDWDCKVMTLIRTTNLGCKNAISSAIDWFFENEEEGIILEDDCLPARSFFYYCDTLLEKYRDDTRIRHIAGCNLHMGKKWGEASIYFANQTHVWGWATWKRVWNDYDKDLTLYNEDEISDKLENVFTDPFVVDDWKKIFKAVTTGEINTWDYQLAFINFFNHGLSINPNVNLISNIGFGSESTHTVEVNSPYSNIPLEELMEISYPKYILPEKKADYAVLSYDFNLKERWKKHNLLRRRFKRWLKSYIFN